MLIIEGADLVGKTTFAKRLLEMLPGKRHVYRHLSRLPEGFSYPWDYLALAHRHSVQDRFHMSEPVYSRVRGEDESPLTPAGYGLVDAHLRTLGAFTVVITAAPDLIDTRYDPETQMYDLDAVVSANVLFLSAVTDPCHTLWAERRPDWDVHISCYKNHPFPDEDDVARVVRDYVKRQASLSAMLMRRLNDHG